MLCLCSGIFKGIGSVIEISSSLHAAYLAGLSLFHGQAFPSPTAESLVDDTDTSPLS